MPRAAGSQRPCLFAHLLFIRLEIWAFVLHDDCCVAELLHFFLCTDAFAYDRCLFFSSRKSGRSKEKVSLHLGSLCGSARKCGGHVSECASKQVNSLPRNFVLKNKQFLSSLPAG